MMYAKKEYSKLLHSPRWTKLRREKLSRCPLCERCEAEGRHALAVEVHHIIPVEDAQTIQQMTRLAYDYHNLQALCHSCHLQTHMELGRTGKAYCERKRKNDIENFKNKFLNQNEDNRLGQEEEGKETKS